MTPKEALDKIRQLFNENAPAPAPAPVDAPAALEAKEYVLEGGAKIMISELEPGGMASLVDDAGNAQPAPVGDHKLADGTVITVGDNGVLTGVVMPESAPEANPEMDEMKAQMASLKAENERIGGLIAEMAKRDEFTAAIEDMKAKVVALAQAFESLVETPSVDPIQTPKDKFVSDVPSKQDRLNALMQTIEKLKS